MKDCKTCEFAGRLCYKSPCSECTDMHNEHQEKNIITDLIKEARELCEKATGKRWIVYEWDSYTGDIAYAIDTDNFQEPGICSDVNNANNAAFIARSRTLIPELAAALEKANVEIATMKTEIKRLKIIKNKYNDITTDALTLEEMRVNAARYLQIEDKIKPIITENERLLSELKEKDAEIERIKAAQSKAIATLQKIEWVGSGAKGLIGDAIGVLCDIEPENEDI